MNYEEKIQELTIRIEQLEKAENKRVMKKKREMTVKILKIVIILSLILTICFYIFNNIIKPYKEKIDYIDQKINTIENFIDEKWDAIQKYNPFI